MFRKQSSEDTDLNGGMWRALVAGICALAIGMGVGRFAYTPLLPLMQQAAGFGNDTAGILASINYAGYLAGALGAAALPRRWSRVTVFRVTLIVSIVATGIMALAPQLWLWSLSRLVAGVASAGILVLSSEIVVRVLNRHARPALIGVHFAGVGIGVALTGLVTALLGERIGWAGSWLVLTGLCVVLAPPCWRWLVLPGTAAAPPFAAAPGPSPAPAAFPLAVLLAAYFCEGAGYIVTGTFLVAIVKAMPGLSAHAAYFWVAVGLAAAPSAMLWSRIGARIGLLPALVAAHAVQALGIVLPVLSDRPMAVLISALLFGGTFVGIAALVVAFAGRAASSNPGRIIGILTAGFSLGQIVGPIAAGVLAADGRGFELPLTLAAATVALGAVLLVAGALSTGTPGVGPQGAPLTTRRRVGP